MTFAKSLPLNIFPLMSEQKPFKKKTKKKKNKQKTATSVLLIHNCQILVS